jgi:hypothetical protein
VGASKVLAKALKGVSLVFKRMLKVRERCMAGGVFTGLFYAGNFHKLGL